MLDRPPRTTGAHTRRTAALNALVQAAVALVVAAIAVGRARGGALSALGLGFLVVLLTTTGLPIAWAVGLWGGALDLLEGRVEPCCDAAGDDDPFSGRRLRRDALGWSGLGAAWAASAAGLLAVALDGRRAGLVVTWVSLTAVAGVASAVVGVAASRAGVHAGRRLDPGGVGQGRAPVAVRRRAWRDLAATAGVVVALNQAGFAWVLFHDAGRSAPVAPLSRHLVLADAVVVVLLFGAGLGWLAARAGRVDGATERVEPDGDAGDAVGRARRSPLGPQAIVYLVLAALVVGRLAPLAVPRHPALWQVMVLRGIYAGMVAWAAVGVGHVRGAVNALAVAGPRVPATEVAA